MILLTFITSSCSQEQNFYRAVDIHDGDTITVEEYACKANCKKTRVRLIGIDTPELDQELWGIKARDFSSSHIANKKIFIEKGITPIDKYGRTLAYVFYCAEELENCNSRQARLLNAELLQHGFAHIYIYPGETKYSAILKEAEYSARSKSLNIWDINNGLELSPAKFRAKQKRQNKK